MRVLVTGANGHIGQAVVTELLQGGHEVVGLVRSDRSATAVRALGAEVLPGDVNDLELLTTTADSVDAVIHLAYDNAGVMNGNVQGAADADVAVVRALGNAYAGTGKTLIGIGMARTDSAANDRMLALNPRVAVAYEVMSLVEKDVRAILVGIPPVTHSDRDVSGFVPTMVRIARARGVSGYPGDGRNHWPAVHTLDLAVLYRLALEQAPAGAQLIGAAEPGVPVRDIAEVIGTELALPIESIPAERVAEHFAPFVFVTLDLTLPNDQTRALLGWQPSHPSLLEDLATDHYFKQ